ncbi:hypothetical protein PENSPDRAFT_658216 [Peniophora sp. CONT]|nr:hypothetical protein PENSPDRAFT_658216 [Peniophora sp. CONT]
MELYSTRSDVARTDLVDSNGFTIYRMITDSSFTKSKTIISRFVPQGNYGPQPVVIAEIVWRNFHDDEITYRGQVHKAKSLIRNHGVWTDKREFTGQSGRAYVWRESVLSIANGVEAARWHTKSHGIFSQAHQAYLQIFNGEVLNDLDDIILVMVYHFGKLAEDTNNAVAAGAAGGAVAAS